jgi:hypothetical protein
MQQLLKLTVRLVCLISAIGLVGCSSSSDGDGSISPGNQPADDDVPESLLNESALTEIEGIWEHRGYGDLYVYENNRTTWYALTENTCLQVFSFAGLIGLSADEVSQTRYALQGDELTFAFPGEAFVTQLQRREEIPSRCDDTVARDAQGVFDYLWATFDEYYAFFDLRGVDWAAEYARNLPQVAAVTDDEALFTLLSDLLSPIDDGHVLLSDDVNLFSPAVERGILAELRRSFDAQSAVTDFALWVEGALDQFRQNIVSRLDDESFDQQGQLAWGTVEAGSVGYLAILSMQGYATDADGEPLDDASTADDLAAAELAMDMAMADLADTSRLIIDLRLNGGGHDSIGLEFARRFVNERQVALSKTARSRDYESTPVQAWLEPQADGAYLQPVTLIVGPDTASAAEIFTIPMQRLSHVRVVGEKTAGSLSDILVKPLPNGWDVGLSNEVYLDADGVSYEGVGITPDIEVSVFSVEAIQAGMDPALDVALSQP